VLLRTTAILLLAAACAPAVELRIEYAALERMLAEQLFTLEGRLYVRGSKTNRCNFAYLEKARAHADSGRLHIRARFTGRSAMNFLGQCVGLGDAFELTIAATPQYRGGNIALADVVVSSDGKTGYYIRRVCAAMSASLGREFKYPVAEEARKALEDPGGKPQYKRELRNFTVPEIRVAPDALVLVLDFQLTVK
jgi:hypothetical protein